MNIFTGIPEVDVMIWYIGFVLAFEWLVKRVQR